MLLDDSNYGNYVTTIRKYRKRDIENLKNTVLYVAIGVEMNS